MSDREAYEAAERLVREAHAKAEAAARAAAAKAPPNGWASSEGVPRPSDLAGLLALVDVAKSSLPPELLRQLADALRELLVALRAVLDYSIDKLERPAPEGPDVEDIPIT